MTPEEEALSKPVGNFPSTPMDAGAAGDDAVDAPIRDSSKLQFIDSAHLDTVLAAYEAAAVKSGMSADLINKGIAFLKTVTPLVANVLLPGVGGVLATQVVNAIPTV